MAFSQTPGYGYQSLYHSNHRDYPSSGLCQQYSENGYEPRGFEVSPNQEGWNQFQEWNQLPEYPTTDVASYGGQFNVASSMQYNHYHPSPEGYQLQHYQQNPTTPLQHPQSQAIEPEPEDRNIEVLLDNENLWRNFSHNETEMIITRAGRRMFPALKLRVRGLDPKANYIFLMDIVPVDCYRYKYHSGRWAVGGNGEACQTKRMYIHPASPSIGAQWMEKAISFQKLKLTNNSTDKNGYAILNSMHKYQPRIHIVKTGEVTQLPWSNFKTFTFRETQFIAVTAYQNEKITKLKIENNPFAKGFREDGAGHRRTSASRLENGSPNENQLSEDESVTRRESIQLQDSETGSKASTDGEETSSASNHSESTATHRRKNPIKDEFDIPQPHQLNKSLSRSLSAHGNSPAAHQDKEVHCDNVDLRMFSNAAAAISRNHEHQHAQDFAPMINKAQQHGQQHTFPGQQYVFYNC